MRYEWLDDYLLSLPGAEKDGKECPSCQRKLSWKKSPFCL